ncbi:MAG: hypothetical protein HN370_07125 [Phycisphaerales bacterium]|jgi:parvulin-like peptidyl-prolyl isomerase|nr:hypothetical protein [Phycisphaerales bacterium]
MKHTALYCCLVGLTILVGCPDTESRLATPDGNTGDGIIRPIHATRVPGGNKNSGETPAVIRMARRQSPDELNRAFDANGIVETSSNDLRRIAETSKDPISLRNLRRRTKESQPTATDAAASEPKPGIASAAPTAAPNTRIIGGATMRVNHQILTVEDILEGLHMELAAVPNNVVGDAFTARSAEIIRKKMAYDIQQRLVYAEAKDRLEDHVKAYIQNELTKVRREMIAKSGSIARLRQKCIAEGTTLDALMGVQNRAMTVRMYLQGKFSPRIVVNRRTLWRYYTTNQTKFTSDKKVQMQVLVVDYKSFLPRIDSDESKDLATAKAKARAHMKKASATLAGGVDFTKVVKEYSFGPRKTDGGIWPMMAKGNKAEEKVEAAAFTQPKNAISDVIEEPNGLYMVRTVATEGGVVTSFEDAQGEIETLLREEQYSKLQGEYFQKLYKRAIIQTPQDFILQAIRRATEVYRPATGPVRKETSTKPFKSNW